MPLDKPFIFVDSLVDVSLGFKFYFSDNARFINSEKFDALDSNVSEIKDSTIQK